VRFACAECREQTGTSQKDSHHLLNDNTKPVANCGVMRNVNGAWRPTDTVPGAGVSVVTVTMPLVTGLK
jgi:hypothetical protein